MPTIFVNKKQPFKFLNVSRLNSHFVIKNNCISVIDQQDVLEDAACLKVKYGESMPVPDRQFVVFDLKLFSPACMKTLDQLEAFC